MRTNNAGVGKRIGWHHIERLAKLGCSTAEIAEALGYTTKAVKYVRKQLGIYVPKKREAEDVAKSRY